MSRAILIVLDSVGCGGAQDADLYGDMGANTLGHIALACAKGQGDKAGLRSGPLHLANLDRLGLGAILKASSGLEAPGLNAGLSPSAQWGYGVETAPGKDTPSGHWEMAGSPPEFAFGYFAQTVPAFPHDLVAALVENGHIPGILGNCHASGTQIMAELGEEHLRTGRPICYTSVDSVFQIAAHEEAFGLRRLYELCGMARQLCNPLNIGRIIARPFLGSHSHDFYRTPNRKDFSMPPPAGTLLDRAHEAGRSIITIGKIGDIFTHRSTGQELKGASNDENFSFILNSLSTLADGGLIFANLVDFDSEFGHRRDVAGYAAALEAFDAHLPALESALKPGDLCVITADHGNDPTWHGTDHTREHVPILCFGPGLAAQELGARTSLADIGASIACHLGLKPPKTGSAWQYAI